MRNSFIQNRIFWAFSISLSFSLFASGCGAGSDPGITSPESASEMAGAVVAGAVASSATSGSQASRDIGPRKNSNWIDQWISLPEAYASTACPTFSSSLSCSGKSVSLTYKSCSFGSSSAIWNGSETLTWSNGSCLSTSPASSFTRTFGAGTTRLAGDGVAVSLDTTSSSGWSTTNSGGGEQITWSSNLTETLNILGIHMVGAMNYTTSKGATKSATVFDFTVNTPTALTLSSSVIPAGTIVVQHNIAKYVGTATIKQPLIFTTSCCHPIAGEIDTAVTGSVTGSEVLVYSSNCGKATFTSTITSINAQSITLNHCI